MARVAMVTRTIKSTKVTCLCLDTITAEPSTQVYQVSGVFPDDGKGNKKLLDVLKKNFETDTFKVVSISDKEVTELLYGMTEQEFIHSAAILPPRPEKKVEAQDKKDEAKATVKANKKR